MMSMRHPSWIAAAATLFLAGCNNQDKLPTPPPAPPVPPAVTDSYAVTANGRLLGFNIAGTGAPQLRATITGLAEGEAIVDIAFRPRDGLLYGLVVGGPAARIVTIDTGTGATTAVSTLVADAGDTSNAYTAVSGTRFGIGFNPVPDRLRVVSDAGENLRINVDTGATITDGALNGSATRGDGTAYTNAFNAACRTQQFTLDAGSDVLSLQNPPNDGTLTAIGSLGVDADAIAGLDVVTSAAGANTLYALLVTSEALEVEEGEDPAFDIVNGIYRIDTATGAATQTGEVGVDVGDTVVGYASRTLDRVPPQAAGELFGLTSAGGYVTFNRAAPSKICGSGAVTGLPEDTTILGIDTQPATGQVVALASDNKLYTIAANGAATERCDLVADPTDVTLPFATLPTEATFGVGFNPVPDRLRVTTDGGLNLRINANPNGSDQCLTITDTALSPDGTTMAGAAYTNAVPAAAGTSLYGIDTEAGSLLLIGNPNGGVASTVGALGTAALDPEALAFTIDGRNNTALLAGVPDGATASTLYTVNLVSGAATAVGSIGGGNGTAAVAPLTGLALTTGTTLRVHALTTDDHLLTFSQTGNTLTPNTVTDVVISGMPSGESLLGLDVRPATGEVIALSSLGNLYTIDTTLGLATLRAPLAADATDLTAPFSGLAGGVTYGVDFNPVPDRLRVVDTAGNNLRINVASGATITDGAINGAATSGVIASAYTNSFAGTTTTTLYNLDATQLFIQNPPNNGTLVAVGSTGVTASGDAGFDIAGGANGLVLAAIRTGGSGPSNLYRINLDTGAATPVGVVDGSARIGSTASAAVRSLAIDLR